MNFKDLLNGDKSNNTSWHQERTILATTEMICGIMKAEGITRKELARRLHCTAGNVTQLLDGTKNMTLRTVSDVFLALGREFQPSNTKVTEQQFHAPMLTVPFSAASPSFRVSVPSFGPVNRAVPVSAY